LIQTEQSIVTVSVVSVVALTLEQGRSRALSVDADVLSEAVAVVPVVDAVTFLSNV